MSHPTLFPVEGRPVRVRRRSAIAKPRPRFDWTELMRLYNEGAEIFELCRRFDMKPKTIYAGFKRLGVAIRPSPLATADAAQLRDLYYREELSLSEIAARYGVTVPAVGHRMRQLGISRRPQGARSGTHNHGWKGGSFAGYLRRKYGLSLEEYLALYDRQGGRCAICRWQAKAPGKAIKKGRWTQYLVVDHDHETDEVRALLCHPCNVGIGHLREDPAILAAAIAYLERRRPAEAGRQSVAESSG